jgi:hypothetical protein
MVVPSVALAKNRNDSLELCMSRVRTNNFDFVSETGAVNGAKSFSVLVSFHGNLGECLPLSVRCLSLPIGSS